MDRSGKARTINYIPSGSSPIYQCAKFFFSSNMQLNPESEMIMACSTQSFRKSLVLSVSIRLVVCIVITHYNPSHTRVSHVRFLLSCFHLGIVHRSRLNVFVTKNHVPSLSLDDFWWHANSSGMFFYAMVRANTYPEMIKIRGTNMRDF